MLTPETLKQSHIPTYIRTAKDGIQSYVSSAAEYARSTQLYAHIRESTEHMIQASQQLKRTLCSVAGLALEVTSCLTDSVTEYLAYHKQRMVLRAASLLLITMMAANVALTACAPTNPQPTLAYPTITPAATSAPAPTQVVEDSVPTVGATTELSTLAGVPERDYILQNFKNAYANAPETENLAYDILQEPRPVTLNLPTEIYNWAFDQQSMDTQLPAGKTITILAYLYTSKDIRILAKSAEQKFPFWIITNNTKPIFSEPVKNSISVEETTPTIAEATSYEQMVQEGLMPALDSSRPEHQLVIDWINTTKLERSAEGWNIVDIKVIDQEGIYAYYVERLEPHFANYMEGMPFNKFFHYVALVTLQIPESGTQGTPPFASKTGLQKYALVVDRSYSRCLLRRVDTCSSQLELHLVALVEHEKAFAHKIVLDPFAISTDHEQSERVKQLIANLSARQNWPANDFDQTFSSLPQDYPIPSRYIPPTHSGENPFNRISQIIGLLDIGTSNPEEGNPRYFVEAFSCHVYAIDVVAMILGGYHDLSRIIDADGSPLYIEYGTQDIYNSPDINGLNPAGVRKWLATYGSQYGWKNITGFPVFDPGNNSSLYHHIAKGDIIYAANGGHNLLVFGIPVVIETTKGLKKIMIAIGVTQSTGNYEQVVLINPQQVYNWLIEPRYEFYAHPVQYK